MFLTLSTIVIFLAIGIVAMVVRAREGDRD
jgi:hypothetical protein